MTVLFMARSPASDLRAVNEAVFQRDIIETIQNKNQLWLGWLPIIFLYAVLIILTLKPNNVLIEL